MRQYIIRRLLAMIPVLLGTSILIFTIFALAPGDAVTSSGNTHITVAEREQLRHQLNLDKPKIVQYGLWLKGAFQGDLGYSVAYKKKVGTVINAYIWNSFYLGLASTLAAVLLAIPLGVISATKQYSFFDSFFTVVALVGISVPSFFLGLLFIKWFAVDIPIFPISGMQATGSTAAGLTKILDILYHMFLPFLVLTFCTVAEIMRYMRSNMLEVIRQDYVRTARAKGLKEKVVIYKHALRNALIPVITLLGFMIPGLFSGAIITEQIFSWPGIGPIQVIAIESRDYYLLMGTSMLFALLTLIGNLCADITYAVVDPRIKLK